MNLPSTTLPVFRTFDDTWKIQNLNLRPSIMHGSRNCSECCELIAGSQRESALVFKNSTRQVRVTNL